MVEIVWAHAPDFFLLFQIIHYLGAIKTITTLSGFILTLSGVLYF
jgi:hypothetical protein